MLVNQRGPLLPCKCHPCWRTEGFPKRNSMLWLCPFFEPKVGSCRVNLGSLVANPARQPLRFLSLRLLLGRGLLSWYLVRRMEMHFPRDCQIRCLSCEALAWALLVAGGIISDLGYLVYGNNAGWCPSKKKWEFIFQRPKPKKIYAGEWTPITKS